ncbi:hypothetical protein V6N11_082433 [Hibiscus sabdariffa]|uniref:Uncharacterized protein n=2 Tax=Hibiscus sabdariffa TaxID=183260 RepID=A0ABR2BTX7_9ROSI
MSACEEERCDQVDARGTNNVVGGCDDGVKVQVDDGVANGVAVRQEESLVRSPEASLGGVCWRGNSLWSGHEGVSNALVPTVREEQLVDVVVNYIGPVVEGSTTEVLVTNEYKRKVRLLIDVISSLQSPEEKRKADKALQRQGHGRPCFLKVWNRESFGSVDLQIEVNTELLNDLEGRGEGGDGLLNTRLNLQGNIWKLLRYCSSIWR